MSAACVELLEVTCGRRVCPDWGSGCGGVDLGELPGLEAGRVSHGACPACEAKMRADVEAIRVETPAAALEPAEVRAHPAGGYTHAVRVPGTVTARVYVGRWSTCGAALAALNVPSAGAAVGAPGDFFGDDRA